MALTKIASSASSGLKQVFYKTNMSSTLFYTVPAGKTFKGYISSTGTASFPSVGGAGVPSAGPHYLMLPGGTSVTSGGSNGAWVSGEEY